MVAPDRSREATSSPCYGLWKEPDFQRCAYVMRMARVNITVPDDLLSQARAIGLNVSRLAAAALAEELERRAKVAELDAYLADLDAEFGPIPQQESVAAREWADHVLPAHSRGTDAEHGVRTV